MRKLIKIGLVIGITIAFLTPISMVLADDTEPPVITSISYGPHAGVRTDPGFYLYQSCNVTDTVSVAEVRIFITGPVGFTPINNSMVNIIGNHYYYEIDNVSISGTYAFYIWAKDTSNNSIQTNTYHMLVFENYLSYIHVDVNNTVGPWNGTAQYPLQSINDALAVIAPNGTIFIHTGVYLNTSISIAKSMNFIGENQNMAILDGGGLNNVIVQTSGYSLITISNLMLRNAMVGIQAHDGANTTVSHCTFTNCTVSGILISKYKHLLVTDCTFQDNTRGIQLSNCSYNQFYHNNFINNAIQVASYFNTSSNAWDNGVTGNFWDTYQMIHPNAHIIPATGTWDTPYVVNVSGNNIDYHPWVNPYGYIDGIPPKVTVIYPNGGELLSGEITIQWSAFDDLTMNLDGTIGIDYSADNGGSWNRIASQQNNTGLYQWNTTVIPDGSGYFIRVSASDDFLNYGSDISNTSFSINNNQHNPPGSLQISGPSAGGNGILFDFTVNATDPEGDQISYKWDWGDGNVTDWLGPFNSGEPIIASYGWATDGNYSIQVKAKDTSGDESNWSEIHPISVAEQVNFSNIKLGTIYIKLFSFNKSFFYSNFLERLRVVIILSSHQLEIKAYATDIVKSVTFKAMNQLAVEDMVIVDNDGSNGFACSMNVSRGVYELNVTAYDINETLVDKYTLSTVFFIRIGRYATGQSRTLEHILSGHRLRP
jgi:parallel beta-helix repeat protein